MPFHPSPDIILDRTTKESNSFKQTRLKRSNIQHENQLINRERFQCIFHLHFSTQGALVSGAGADFPEEKTSKRTGDGLVAHLWLHRGSLLDKLFSSFSLHSGPATHSSQKLIIVTLVHSSPIRTFIVSYPMLLLSYINHNIYVSVPKKKYTTFTIYR